MGLCQLVLVPVLLAPSAIELERGPRSGGDQPVASIETSLALSMTRMYESTAKRSEPITPSPARLEESMSLAVAPVASPVRSSPPASAAGLSWSTDSSLALGAFTGPSLDDRSLGRSADVPGLVLAGGSGASPLAIALADAHAGLWQGETGDLGAAMLVGYKFSWWGNEAAFVAGARVTRPDYYKGRENTDLSFKTLELMPFFGVRVRF